MARNPPFIVPALALLALAGWGWGIYQAVDGTGPRAAAATADGPSNTTRKGSRHEARTPSISSLLPTDRSARLFSSLDEIAGEPKGSVNKRLMAAMRTTLADNDPTRRGRDFALLLDLMRPEDSLAVHDLFLELHRDGQTLGEYAPFANRWGQIDGAGALESLMNEQPMRLPPQDFRNIIIGWSTHDPLSALAWMKEHPDVPGSTTNFDAVIQGWINLDRDAATRYLVDQPLSLGDRVRATGNAADEILSGAGIEATVAWLTALPAGPENNLAANAALQAIGWRLNELPYDKAASAWANLSKQSIGQIDQLERFANASGTARQATNGSRGFIDALATTWPVEEATERFTAWSAQDPRRVNRFLSQHADSPYIETIREQLAAKGIDLTPVPGGQARDRFEDPEIGE